MYATNIMKIVDIFAIYGDKTIVIFLKYGTRFYLSKANMYV